MIKLVRVDHRLLHGQVIFSWTKYCSINHFVIVDDDISNDPIRSMALGLAKPADCSLDIISFDKLRANIDANSSKNIMIIIKGVKEAAKVSEILPEVQEINYGGIAKKENSQSFGQAVFLNSEELRITRDLINKGLKIFVQQIPSSSIEATEF